MWGQRICDPGPLYIRAQGPSRRKTLSRTCNESTNGLEIKTEGDAVLSIPKRSWKKGQVRYRNSSWKS